MNNLDNVMVVHPDGSHDLWYYGCDLENHPNQPYELLVNRYGPEEADKFPIRCASDACDVIIVVDGDLHKIKQIRDEWRHGTIFVPAS